MRSKREKKTETTIQNIVAGLKETGKRFRELEKKYAKERKEREKQERQLKAEYAEERKEREKQERQLKAMYVEDRKERKKLDRQLNEMYAESRKEMKALNKQVGGISNSNGEIAEEYFFNAFKAHKFFANEKYDFVQRPTRITNGNLEAEFDIILFNGKSVAIIEVKYNAKPDNISVRRLISQVENFRTLYPNLKNHNIYLGVAALRFKEGLEQRLHRNGIASIRQIGKKMVVYDTEVKAF
jgi:Holliday junction resolvase-like predicted endonuclease